MIPEKIGRYKVISELGRGGMATVFHSYDPSFERNVAIKVLPRAFLHDPQFRTRFEREAKTVAALEHATIVPVYDFGEEDGQPYIVMRMMSGGSLAEKIKEGTISLDVAVNIIVRISQSLDAAHDKGIIHRDIKPGNILFDQYDKAYLSDFGIARITEAGATLTGSSILGTPAYMSPEQVQGDSEMDGRSDIYSLGVIFYQILAGEAPYQATTPAKVMMMHILEPVPNLLDKHPEVPKTVGLWLEKALAKDPDQRFSTAGEMGAALEKAIQGELHPTLQDMPKPAVTPVDNNQVTMASVPATIATTPSDPTHAPVSTPATPIPAPGKAVRKRRWLPITIGLVGLGGIAVIAIVSLVYLGMQGNGPLAMLAPATATLIPTKAAPTDTPLPLPTLTQPVVAPTSVPVSPTPSPSPLPSTATATEALPSETPEPTGTSPPELLTIGGADKIAFQDANNIWVMNVDGSDLQQLTTDGALKSNLGWTPDGAAVTFISGRCVWEIGLDGSPTEIIACIDNAEYLEAFEISPDGQSVAMSVNRELYLIPYDRESLSTARTSSDLKEINICPVLSPLVTSIGSTIPVKGARWSRDGQKLAILILANEGGKQVDLIRFLDITDCENGPNRIDEFPATRFDIAGYDDTPYIQNFGYDGGSLFAMVSFSRNDGYGDLYIYNEDAHKAEEKINPVDGLCCYRDPQFSPDGRFIIFAYQPYEANAKAKLYYITAVTLGTGAQYEPLPLPDDFLSYSRVKPFPALRPAGSGAP